MGEDFGLDKGKTLGEFCPKPIGSSRLAIFLGPLELGSYWDKDCIDYKREAPPWVKGTFLRLKLVS